MLTMSFRGVLLLMLSCATQWAYSQAAEVAANVLTTTVPGGNFETPDLAPNTFQYAPTGSAWTFTGGAAIAENNSGFTNSNADAPQGSQVLVLQNKGKATQTITIDETGAYRFRFFIAQRQSYGTVNLAGQTVEVWIGNTKVGEVKPTSANYEVYNTVAIKLNAGSYVLKVQGLNPAGGDNSAFLDAFQLQKIPEWSKGTTWNTGSVPNGSKMVMIPMDKVVALDGNANVKTIMNMGSLLAVNNKNVQLSTKWLMVMGMNALFEWGQERVPYQSHTGTITLKGSDNAELIPNTDVHSKAIMVMNGGKWEMHGRPSTRTRFIGKIQNNILVPLEDGTTNVIMESPITTTLSATKTLTSSSNEGNIQQAIPYSFPISETDTMSWTYLAETAEVGDNTITIASIMNWRVGDEIIISSTDYDAHQAEKRTITALGGVTGGENKWELTLDEPLNFMHWGTIQTYNNGVRTFQVDERAEVGLLTRNIKIQGDDTSESNGFGGHTMVMPSAEVHVSGVEFFQMGQKSELARYPFHWHFANDVTGQYIKDCSVHRSYNRAVTVHHTDNAIVEKVVAYDHLGHGFFLEDGSETGNLFKENLGILTRLPAEGEEVRPHDRVFRGPYVELPATYWITNPANDFIGNACGGSEGSGFWMVMLEKELHNGTQGPKPGILPMGRFEDNRSHSTSFSNFGIDGGVEFDTEEFVFGHYRPQENGQYVIPEIDRFTGFKCRDRCIWMRANTMHFNDCVLADNGRATFFAYNQILKNSIIVGQSDNIGNPQSNFEISAGRSLPRPDKTERLTSNRLRGHSIYDGSSGIENVHFADFAGFNSAIQTNGAAQKSTVHFASGITFDPAIPEANKLDFTPQANRDFMYASGLLDLDGSITGTPGMRITAQIRDQEIQVLEEGFNIEDGAILKEEWGAYLCPNEHYALLRLENKWPRYEGTPIYAIRSDGAATFNRQTNDWYSQNPVIVNQQDLIYYFQYHEISNKIDLRLRFIDPNDYVIYAFPNFPSTTKLSGNVSQVNSLDEVKSSSGQSYFFKDNTLYMKSVGTLQAPSYMAQFGDVFGTQSEIFSVCQNNNCANPSGRLPYAVLADYEMGIDSRATFARKGDLAIPTQITDVTNQVAAPFDNVDNKISYTVTSDGDGTNEYVDYNLHIPRQVWSEYKSLSLKFDGPPLQVFIRDQTDGFRNLGIYQSSDSEHINLGHGNGLKFKDEVVMLKLRCHESMFSDLKQAGVQAFISLYDIKLHYQTPASYSDPINNVNYILDNDGDGITRLEEIHNDRSDDDVTDFRFDFNKEGYSEGWYKNIHVYSDILNGYNWVLKVKEIDPQIIRDNLNLEADQMDKIRVRIKSQQTGNFQLFWTTDTPGEEQFHGTRSMTVNYSTANTWKTIVFNVGTHTEWQGKITRLRFDPIGSPNNTKYTWINWIDHQPIVIANSGKTDKMQELTESALWLAINPNPNEGRFNLDLSAYEKKAVTLSCYNVEGKLLFTKPYTEDHTLIDELDLSMFDSGMYVLVAESPGKEPVRKKFVIK